MARIAIRWLFRSRRGGLMVAAAVGLVCSAAVVTWALAVSIAHRQPADRWTIHEWGTFTALQNDAGVAAGGINVDDEPLPDFVHDLYAGLINRPFVPRVRLFDKGLPIRYPQVTLRLETPVLYFHPPQALAGPTKIDVDVALHGGWLTQFYPAAKNDNADIHSDKYGNLTYGPLTPQTVGRLAWHGLTVYPAAEKNVVAGPLTKEHIWLAPRQVEAADVTAAGGESERYLFYRGVANFSAPLEVIAARPHDRFDLHGRFEEVLAAGQREQIGRLWLVHILADGRVAFRAFGPLAVDGDRQPVIGQTRASFDAQDFTAGKLAELQQDLHAALVADGLNADEAAAMVATWDQAYFHSPGLRLFFLVPQVWTDHYLPLTVSVPAEVRRVMVGRIELTSPEQRKLLDKLSNIKTVDIQWFGKIGHSPAAEKFFAGRSDFGDLGVKIPEDYQAYLDLGRFRNALVLDRQKQHPTPGLQRFITMYGLDR